MNYIRYPFFVVNTLFMIFGIAIMSLGILLLTNYSVLEHMLNIRGGDGGEGDRSGNYSESVYRSDVPVILQPNPAPRWLTRIRDPASYLLIAFGAFYFTLSFIGFCGAVKDSRCLMVIYAITLVVLLIIQIVGVFLYIKYKPDLKAEVELALKDQYRPEEMRRFTQFEFILDLLMINYKCCGVNNQHDFKEAYSSVYTVRSLPIDPRHHQRGRGKAPSYGIVTLSPDIELTSDSKEDNNDGIKDTKNVRSSNTSAVEVIERVVTGPVEPPPSDRLVPVSCCKLNLTNLEATRLLRNIYRKQGNKLALLEYAVDDTCVTTPEETNAYVGDSHGCFSKIQGEITTPLRIGVIIMGLIQLCGLVFAGFIFKTAYYDWYG